MSDFPTSVIINEEGPREGFQIEAGPIATSDKVRYIEALAETGVKKIDCVSFVSPTKVPGMIDAPEVANSIRKRPGVSYTGLWLNVKGLQRALETPLDILGAIRISTSDTFSRRNTGMGRDETIAEQRRWLDIYRQHSVPVRWGYVMTAFGCNYEGPKTDAEVVRDVAELLSLAAEADVNLESVFLADTVGVASPREIASRISAVRDRWPDLELGLHLHDTRGLGLANAYEALRLGVRHFDATNGGLGGCPFAGHKGAAGNVCTDELVHLCHQLGIETGIDLEALVECARLAESIVGHSLPGKLTRGGTLAALMAKAAG
jgi:hydroxymethylglutaryl-CoA lyase